MQLPTVGKVRVRARPWPLSPSQRLTQCVRRFYFRFSLLLRHHCRYLVFRVRTCVSACQREVLLQHSARTLLNVGSWDITLTWASFTFPVLAYLRGSPGVASQTVTGLLHWFTCRTALMFRSRCRVGWHTGGWHYHADENHYRQKQLFGNDFRLQMHVLGF